MVADPISREKWWLTPFHGATIPFATGLGAAARVARTAGNAADAAAAASKTTDELYSVYVLKDPLTGEIKYVGHTKQNVTVRATQHSYTDPKNKSGLIPQKVGSAPNKTQARLLEQAAIEGNGGIGGSSKLLNRINSVGANSELYKAAGSYLELAGKAIKNNDYSTAATLLRKASGKLSKVK